MSSVGAILNTDKEGFLRIPLETNFTYEHSYKILK